MSVAPCIAIAYSEVICHLHGDSCVRLWTTKVESGRQELLASTSGWIHVECWREAPTVFIADEAVVAKVVVCVSHRAREDCPSPEFGEITVWIAAVLLDELGKLQVRIRFPVVSLHCGEPAYVGNPVGVVSVESQ